MIEKRKNDETVPYEAIVPAFMLIGIGLIFWLGLDVWPWIMVVIGASMLAKLMLRGDLTPKQLDGILWVGGIFLLATTHFWWPGILILIGLSMALKSAGGAMYGAAGREKQKNKRGFPTPPASDDTLY